MASGGDRRPFRSRSDRLAARAVTLAVDPTVTLADLAAILGVLADDSRDVLENALRRVSHRDRDVRSQVNTRAAIGLRLALAQHRDDGNKVQN